MRVVDVGKKMMFIFLSVLFLVSCGSDDAEIVKSGSGLSEEEKNYTKELILQKFKELGLNPDEVSFTDDINPSECIILKSLDDLEKIFPRDTILNEEELLPVLDTVQGNTTTIKYGRDWDWVDYCYYSGQFPVRGAANLTMHLSFNYDRNLLDTGQFDAITNVFTDVTGVTFGRSYSQSYYYFDANRGAPYELTVEGILSYYIGFKGIGTYCRKPLITKGRFSPPLGKYGGAPSYAFFAARLKIME